MDHQDNIAQALRDYHAYTNNLNVAQDNSRSRVQNTMPTAVYGGNQSDHLADRIRRYLEEEIPIVTIPEKYARLEMFTPDMRVEKRDFPDDFFLSREGFVLTRLTPEQVCAYGRIVIPMISSGFTRRGAAILFVLAYHLRKTGCLEKELYVLDGYDEISSLYDITADSLSNTEISTENAHVPIPEDTDPLRAAAAYSFIACSLLRIFTKPAANYVKAWNHIVSSYRSFYGKPVNINLPNPNENSLKALKNWIAVEPRAKATLYRILYLSNGNQNEDLGLKKFLYDNHLINTGMHIVNIFVELCKKLNCNTGVILTILNSGETRRQIKAMVAWLGLLKNEATTHRRRMWRYGRIFDETFMSSLQTKACPKLVYILAEALRSEDPVAHDGILNIVQLADVSEENKKKCRVAAQKLLKLVRERAATSE